MRPTNRLNAAVLGAALLTTTAAGGALAQDVEGTVDVHGSSTVAPISLAVSEDFAALNPGFGFGVGEEGTGDGFSQFFCVDNSDVSDASRAIDEDEAALCAENGVETVELKIGYDGLAVIASPENPIECLNQYDLWAIFGVEANDDPTTPDAEDPITTWAQAEAFAHSMGSTTDFPDGDIAITAPGTESGTYDSFVDLALGPAAEERGLEPATRDPVPPTYVGAANDRVIIQGVSQFPTSIGFVGLSYADAAGDAVKIVAVDEGEGCVAASPETVADGTYVLSRPLYIYPALNRLGANPAIAPWVDFYLSDEGIANVSDVGYVQLPAEELEATRAAWAEASGM
jgi:phosphate transport system substrate-binding protein